MKPYRELGPDMSFNKGYEAGIKDWDDGFNNGYEKGKQYIMNNNDYTVNPEPLIDITFRNLSEEDVKGINNWRNYWSSLWELDQWLRSKIKYNNISAAEADAYDKVRDELRNVMDINGCSLEDLN